VPEQDLDHPDRVPGLTLQSVGFTDFRLSRAADQDGFSEVGFVDTVGIPNTLGLRLTVATRERNAVPQVTAGSGSPG